MAFEMELASLEEVMDNFWQSLKTTLSAATVDGIIKIVLVIVLLVLGFAAINWVNRAVKKSRLAQRIDKTVFDFLRSFLSIALKTMLIFMAATVLGVPSSSLVALIGSAGLAIGLALQGSLSNLAGGMMIVIFKPFRVGDYIEMPDGKSGTVAHINVFYTTLRTADNRAITLPNGSLSNANVTNYTASTTRRIELLIGVAYGSDVEKVKKVLLSVANRHEGVLEEPLPLARLNELQPSCLQFVLRAWCATDRYWDVRFDLVEGVKVALEREGIVLPLPQMHVHLEPAQPPHQAL